MMSCFCRNSTILSTEPYRLADMIVICITDIKTGKFNINHNASSSKVKSRKDFMMSFPLKVVSIQQIIKACYHMYDDA